MGGKLPTQTYFGIAAKKIDSDILRERLKLKHLELKGKLAEVHPHVDKFFKEKNLDPGKIREHSTKLISAGAIAGALLLTSPSDQLKLLPPPQEIIDKLKIAGSTNKIDNGDFISKTLKSVLPARPRPLIRNEEKFIEQIFTQVIGISAKASLEGEHLNTTYGYIGAEQHLKRYPGDTLKEHGSGEILKSGISPGRGAWGYFAPSKAELKNDLVETEKWYAVVQTLYLPDWNKRVNFLREWYKYRKVLIVNTDNGNAVVAAIADSGPAAWTGKHFGGSPEVMHELGGSSYKKGAVILFFVDDPENKVPLGPVEYNKTN